MGKMSFYDFQLALEADDITEEARQMRRNTAANVDDEGDENLDNRGNIDDNTDDILGTNETPEETEDDPTADETEETAEEDPNADPADDEFADEDIDESGEDETPEETADDIKKRKLKKNMILFYNIISSNINIISSTDIISEDEAVNKVYINVQHLLMECKRILFEYITNDFNNDSYAQALRKYVNINKIYDICIKMLENNTKNVELLQSAKLKKSKKISV